MGPNHDQYHAEVHVIVVVATEASAVLRDGIFVSFLEVCLFEARELLASSLQIQGRCKLTFLSQMCLPVGIDDITTRTDKANAKRA